MNETIDPGIGQGNSEPQQIEETPSGQEAKQELADLRKEQYSGDISEAKRKRIKELEENNSNQGHEPLNPEEIDELNKLMFNRPADAPPSARQVELLERLKHAGRKT